jgi:hypothetical protein
VSNKLDQIQIPKPCPSDWEEMTGNDRIRYCEECKKHVYNLSKMSRREAEALIATRRGNLCARIVRQPDGSILTEEITPSIHQGIFRASPVASAVVTAVLTISSSGFAQTPVLMGKPIPTVTKEAGSKKPNNEPQTGAGIASIAGVVTDISGAIIVAATVKLINKQTGSERTFSTSEDGDYNFDQVDAGSYTLKVEAPNFAPAQIESVVVQQGEECRVDLPMRAALVSQGGLVIVPTVTLRELYNKSDLIVVVRTGKSTTVKTDGEARLSRTRLQVSSTHKGLERGRTVDFYHWVYGEDDEAYKSGSNLLLFLKPYQDGQGGAKKGYELVDSQRGIKQLPEADLQVYLQRIDELATIMSKEKHERAEIVEWLVRCAEDPATRWEGVTELEQGADSLSEVESDDSIEVTEEVAGETESQAEAQVVEEQVVEEEVTEIKPNGEDSSEKGFAELLTAAQKERLRQTLFNIETITDKDAELIELVKHWDDGRLAPFLLSQLRRMEAAPSRLAEEIIHVIAFLLKDEAITAYSEQYSENVSYEDEESEEASEQGEDAEDAKDAAASRAEAKRNRSEMLRRFIALADSKVKQ